jgi:hypothetical protein
MPKNIKTTKVVSLTKANKAATQKTNQPKDNRPSFVKNPELALDIDMGNYIIRWYLLTRNWPAEYRLRIQTRMKFLNNEIVAHRKKTFRLSGSMYLLLRYFFLEAQHFLSKEDIRQDVLFDDDAREGSIRSLLYETRKWLKQHDIPLDIVTINPYKDHPAILLRKMPTFPGGE